ncbi:MULTISPECIES: HEPN domain-containing protein [Thermus]|uniref:HEPN domain-containing protein n=1 Tax=Thermus TaxID=270 RepID=UPI001F3FD2C1|nr:HEPN domain-containing protein [Thermus brockianus]
MGEALRSLLPQALALDKLYIPTRYPDALPGLTPKEAYTREEAEKALRDGQAILKAVEAHFGREWVFGMMLPCSINRWPQSSGLDGAP